MYINFEKSPVKIKYKLVFLHVNFEKSPAKNEESVTQNEKSVAKNKKSVVQISVTVSSKFSNCQFNL